MTAKPATGPTRLLAVGATGAVVLLAVAQAGAATVVGLAAVLAFPAAIAWGLVDTRRNTGGPG